MRAVVKRVAEQYIDLPAIRRVTAIWIVLLLATASAAFAQTDTVTTVTGETIIGEIISIEKDVLTISTPYSDADFKIKWDQVVAIDSPRQFLIETFDGRRLSGSLTDGRGRTRSVQVGADTIGLAEVSIAAAIRAIVLVEVRDGRRLRLQHDAGQRGQAAHHRRQHAVSG